MFQTNLLWIKPLFRLVEEITLISGLASSPSPTTILKLTFKSIYYTINNRKIIIFKWIIFMHLFIYLLRAEGSVNIKKLFSIFLPGGFYCLINPSLESSSNFVTSLTDFCFLRVSLMIINFTCFRTEFLYDLLRF